LDQEWSYSFRSARNLPLLRASTFVVGALSSGDYH